MSNNKTHGKVGPWHWDTSDEGMSGLPSIGHNEWLTITLGYGDEWGWVATCSDEDDDAVTCPLPDRMLTTAQAACAYLAAKHGVGDLDTLMLAVQQLRAALANK